jgi:hypothetical protein
MKDNIIAALEHNDRVCHIELILAELLLEYFTNSSAILEPFPELTFLHLGNLDRHLYGELEPILPNLFLGGSAPQLESLHLDRVSFPGLPNLLLSTTHLVNLHLHLSIPILGTFHLW